MSNITTNATVTDTILLDSFILILYSLTFVIGMIGNLLVLKVIWLQRQKAASRSTSTTNIYLANLALSDLLSATTITLQFCFCSYHLLENFLISPYLCIVFKSIQILMYNVSILTMVVIAIDRYRLIHNPLRSSNKRLNPKYSLSVVWLLAILYALTCLVSMKVSEYFLSSHKLVGCRILFANALPVSSILFRKIRVTILAVCFYFVPLLITVSLYTLSVRIISRRSAVGYSNYAQCDESKQRTIKILILILFVFALCWLPIHIMNLNDFHSPSTKSVLNTPKSKQCNASTTYSIFYWLAINSCCYNPFIYSCFNKRFRELLPKFSCQQKQPRNGSDASQTSSIFYLSNSS